MKVFYLFILMTMLHCHLDVHAQVGIGTTAVHESAIMQIDNGLGENGILIPKVSILDVNTKAPITTATIKKGLLVYNTNAAIDKGYYYWDGAKWVRWLVKSTHRPSIKYISNNNSQNFNNNSYVPMEIFDELKWNDDSSIFEFVNKTTIRVKKTGRYQINGYLSFILSDDVGVLTTFRKNGNISFGARYISRKIQEPNSPNGVTLKESVELTANDEIQIVSKKSPTGDNPDGNTKFATDGDSYIEIVLLK